MFIDPVAIRIGPLAVHWYGIIIAAAVLIGGVIGTMEARRRGEDPDKGWSMLLPTIVLAVIAARAYHVIHEWDFYRENPALITQVWNGGIGIPGAVMGGALAIYLYCRWNKLNTARWLDIFAPALLLGQVVGRLGNFVNQELYGPPTTLPWGIPIDAAHRAGTPWDALTYPVDTTRFHPLFAYEMILNAIGVVVLLWIARRFARRLYDGDVALIYIMWYGAVRTALESFRNETGNWHILGIPTAMWIGIIGFIVAGAFLVIRHQRGWGTPGAWIDQEPSAPDDDDASRPHATEPSTG